MRDDDVETHPARSTYSRTNRKGPAMTYLLIANAVFEALFGVLMIAAPGKVLKDCDGLAASIAGSLGAAEIAIAALSAVIVVRAEPAAISGLVALTVFHVGLAASLVRGLAGKHNPPPPVIAHLVFAILFAVTLVRAL
jgi:hypothetical protein